MRWKRVRRISEDSQPDGDEDVVLFAKALVRGLDDRVGNDGRDWIDEVKLPDRDDMVSIYYSSFRQPFSLEYYVIRLLGHMRCSPSAFVVALVYLDRMAKVEEKLVPCQYNVHRLFLTAVVLAAKFYEDEVQQNNYYARIGGISIQEMNRLELHMLMTLKFDLSVNPELYVNTLLSLESRK